MKSYITTKEELNRMSVKELQALFNRVSSTAYSKDSDDLDKVTAKASMEQIKRALSGRRP